MYFYFQNEEDKPKHRRQVTVHTTVTDLDPCQKLLSRISNLENFAESRHMETVERLDRIERLLINLVQQKQQ